MRDESVHPVEALILSSLRAANQGDGTVTLTKADLEAIREFLFAKIRAERQGGTHEHR
jgi:hypothetical protein